MTFWAVSAVQEQSRREQAAQQAAQAARQQADQAGAAVQSRERGLQDQQVLLQDAQSECAEHKRAADQAAEELSQEQHKRQRVQEDLVVSWRCNGLPLGLGAAADWEGLMHALPCYQGGPGTPGRKVSKRLLQQSMLCQAAGQQSVQLKLRPTAGLQVNPPRVLSSQRFQPPAVPAGPPASHEQAEPGPISGQRQSR